MPEIWLPPGTSREDLFKSKLASYRPQSGLIPQWQYHRLPPFNIFQIEQMRRDDAVKLAMAIKTAPLLRAKFTISGRPEIVEFVKSTLRRFWNVAMPKVIDALWYTRSAGEVVYKLDGGRVQFDRYRQVYPSDAKVLTKNGDKWGVKVKVRRTKKTGDQPGEVVLAGPKSFVYVHGRKFGSWHGHSEFEGSYSPWHEKASQDGAQDSRKMWHYKNAFDSGAIYHPDGDYTLRDGAGDAQKVSYQHLALQMIEMMKNGAAVAFPSTVDDHGNRKWQWDRPTMNGSGEGLLNYVDHLDTKIFRGMEIPDDIISQVSGTGSFAGRTIPLSAFFNSQNVTLRAIFQEVKEQLLDYLVRMNYGSTDYEVQKVEVDIDELMPATPSGQEDAKAANDAETEPVVKPQQQLSVDGIVTVTFAV